MQYSFILHTVRNTISVIIVISIIISLWHFYREEEIFFLNCRLINHTRVRQYEMSKPLSARPVSKHDIHVKHKIHAVIECHWITISEIMAPYFPTVSFEKWVLANTGAKWTPRSCLLGLLLSKLRFEGEELVVIYFFRGIMHFFTSNEDVRQTPLLNLY